MERERTKKAEMKKKVKMRRMKIEMNFEGTKVREMKIEMVERDLLHVFHIPAGVSVRQERGLRRCLGEEENLLREVSCPHHPSSLFLRVFWEVRCLNKNKMKKEKMATPVIEKCLQ